MINSPKLEILKTHNLRGYQLLNLTSGFDHAYFESPHRSGKSFLERKYINCILCDHEYSQLLKEIGQHIEKFIRIPEWYLVKDN